MTRSVPRVLPGILATLGLAVCGLLPAAEPERELIRDPHFQNGFLLLEPKPGKRIIYGEIRNVAATAQPVWDLAQWSSKLPLDATRATRLPDGALCFTNTAKQIVIGKPDSAAADLSLGVIATVEYGNRARQSTAEPWVHLLVQQEVENAPPLTELAACRFHLEARLKRSRLFRTDDYSPARHAAQFLVYFTICNRNPNAPGIGQCFWFGIPVYDDRERMVPLYQAQDFGATRLFISTQASAEFTRESTHDGQWVTFARDLLPLMRAALEAGWKRGFMPGSREFGDYRLSGVFIGWEVPGILDVDMQIRNLSLKAVPRAPVKPPK